MSITVVKKKKPKILIVDDSSENIDVLSELLKPYYRRAFALFGHKALDIISSDDPPDLVLLDVMMPGMDGFEVCRRLKENPKTVGIPIIFVTAMGATKDEVEGFEAGGVDYITKPISPHTVLARIATQLELSDKRRQLERQNEILEEQVTLRTQDLKILKDTALQTLANLAETRDNETGGHINRTRIYVEILANKLRNHPRFKDYLNERTIGILTEAAPLHDIGKVGVPDRILLKKGRLTEEEFSEMKRHTIYGKDSLQKAKISCHGSIGEEVFSTAMEIANYHHEKWGGGGYPEGLKGEQIPVPARLMAIADVYDALVSHRCYKSPMGHEKAFKIITQGDNITSPQDFDPDALKAFEAVHEQFKQIAANFADSNWEREIL
jgi:putative two-component system response regulator